MSQQLINRSPDLTRLRDSGYSVSIVAAHLVIDDVPYVDAQRTIQYGRLVSTLTLAGDRTARPDTHVIYFCGGHPCTRDGRKLTELEHGESRQNLAGGLVVDRSFSHKPTAGYADYFEKIEGYVGVISNYASSIDPSVTAKCFRPIETVDEESVFRYLDTASSKAGITNLATTFRGQRIAIVGVGGTGSYILDLVAKTYVDEIHLFDFDRLYTNNAFRAPGAASLETLRESPTKVAYFQAIYDKMRRGIFAHDYRITSETVAQLANMSFVFICLDRGEARKLIIEALEANQIPFIDVGMGVERTDESLRGIVRVTTSTKDKREHVRLGRVSFGENDVGEYDRNIQTADLNALNAALAVIKWKKLYGFYADLEQEYHSTYTIDGNIILNDEKNTESRDNVA